MRNIVLVDGVNWYDLLPLTFTRPVSYCRCGIMTIREKWLHYLNGEISSFTRPYLQNLFPFHLEDDNYLVNSSLLPDRNIASKIKNLSIGGILINDGNFVAARLDRKEAKNFMAKDPIRDFQNAQEVEGLSFIRYPEDIINLNRDELIKDYEIITSGRSSTDLAKTNRSLGNDIFVETGAMVSHSILDSTSGPIYIAKNAKILEGCLIKGPLSLGKGSLMKMGAKCYGSISTGENCKLGGEVKNSVIFGNSNKSHDGYLGDSVIGEWCNFGAGSSVSNMKNTMGKVSLWDISGNRKRKTQLSFCGTIMGDHSKCAINTSFNTGAVIGVFANIFGFDPSGYVPSFSWGENDTYQQAKMIEVCRLVMGRKNLSLSKNMEHVLIHLHQQASGHFHHT